MISLGLLAAVASSSLDAQVVELQLTTPDATFPEAFSLIQGTREMPDGRVMIADPLGQALVIADVDAGVADTIGRPGQGPAEYRQPDGVFALPGDSTLLVDLGNARLTVLDPDGSFGETMSTTRAEPGPGGRMLIVLPRGVDSQGRIYFQPFGGGRPDGQLPDSVPVLRLDRGTGAIDTVAQVKLPSMKRSTSGGSGNRQVSIRLQPLTPRDAWAVAWDGRLAVARSGDYHVEWIEPNGERVRGGAVPSKPVPIRRADKQEWLGSLGVGLRIGMEIENGRRRVSLSRGSGGGSGPDIDSYDWPETKPAFAADGVWVTPEGEMWVERHVPAGTPRRFDVFGADAELKGSVTLPAGRRLVGFGRGTVYLIRTDEFDLQWLERYRRS